MHESVDDMTRAVLLTLGRLPKGLELARCLSKAGHTVYVADPFGLHLSKPSRYVKKSVKVTPPNDDQAGFLNDILATVQDYGIDLIIPISEEVVHVAQLDGRLPKGTTLFCPLPDQLGRLHDKFAFIQTARAIGLAVPETHRADTPAALRLAAKSDYVIKPALGCSGAGLRLAKKGALVDASERSPRNVLQRRINGEEVSTFSVVRDGRVLGNVVYKGLIFAGTVATCFERIESAQAVEDWIQRFVEAERYSGFIAFDFIIDTAGMPHPIECNPRMTSGVHFLRHDDLAKAVLDADPQGAIRFKDEPRFQEGHTSLTKAYSALPHFRTFLRRLKLVLTTRDVLWSWRDPLPFVLMTPMSWPVLSQVMFKGVSFGQAATRDIEWQPVISGGNNQANTSTPSRAADHHESAASP